MKKTLDKKLVKGLIIGMLIAATVVTLYYRRELNKIEDHYNKK